MPLFILLILSCIYFVYVFGWQFVSFVDYVQIFKCKVSIYTFGSTWKGEAAISVPFLKIQHYLQNLQIAHVF